MLDSISRKHEYYSFHSSLLNVVFSYIALMAIVDYTN